MVVIQLGVGGDDHIDRIRHDERCDTHGREDRKREGNQEFGVLGKAFADQLDQGVGGWGLGWGLREGLGGDGVMGRWGDEVMVCVVMGGVMGVSVQSSGWRLG